MEREVFVLRNGDSFSTWKVQFDGLKEHREDLGRYSYTIESARVRFCATPATVHVGEWGLLSSANGRFYDVKVTFIELAQGHVVVHGDASRTFDHKENR